MTNTTTTTMAPTGITFDPTGWPRRDAFTLERITCKDGVTLSVQASQYHYCHPRGDRGPWTHVEVGFIRDGNDLPVAAPDSWVDYAEDGHVFSDVFAYIPAALVADFIAFHNGDRNEAPSRVEAPSRNLLDRMIAAVRRFFGK